jgi:ferric-dicitrate binding protein FerR (iron transport regulator)
MMLENEEEVTARLLRLAGRRPEAPADRAARVRGDVHRHWQAATRRRALRRRALLGTALLASAATATLVVKVLTPRDVGAPTLAETIASVEQVEGDAGLTRGDGVRTGQWLETGARGRAALRLADGTSMRLDTDARARLLSPAILELTRGTVYLDTGERSTGLEVRTPFGVARDIGTQFEVRLTASSLRVRVRAGLVELRRGEQSVSARPGTEVTLGSGPANTRPVPAFGPEWQWAADLAPVFDIEGRSLAAFLGHLSREQGWTVRYADAQLARDASGIILHGSVRGLEPADAVAVALRTSALSHRFDNGELVVMRSREH